MTVYYTLNFFLKDEKILRETTLWILATKLRLFLCFCLDLASVDVCLCTAGVVVLLAGWFVLSAEPSEWSSSNTGDDSGSGSSMLLIAGPVWWSSNGHRPFTKH